MSSELQQLVGSFWSEVFESSGEVDSLLSGLESLQQQEELNRLRRNAAVSAQSIQPLQIDAWERLEKVSDQTTTIKYDDGYTYGGGVVYDQQDNKRHQIYIGDTSISSIDFLCNNPNNPTIMLSQGIDYVVDQGVIFLVYTLEEYGLDEDSLWGRNVGRDIHDIYRLLGYAAGFDCPGTDRAKTCFESFWDMLLYGPTWLSLMRFICNAAGTDCFDSDETVGLIRHTPWGPVVVTNKRSYFSVPNTEIGYSPQDLVLGGDPVGKTILVIHNKRDQFDQALIPPAIWVDENSIIVKNNKAAGRHLCIIKGRVITETPEEFSLLTYLRKVYPAHGNLQLIIETTIPDSGWIIGDTLGDGTQDTGNQVPAFGELSGRGEETFPLTAPTGLPVARIRQTT